MSFYKVEWQGLKWEEPIEGLRLKAVREGGKQLRVVFVEDI